MARIAEELLLLLLDNAAGTPALPPARRHRLLAGAALLDLAYAWRLRPADADDPVPAGRLLALPGPDDGDPVNRWAWEALARRPVGTRPAITKLHRNVEPAVLAHLERTGQLRRTPVYTKRSHVWLLTDRDRALQVRSALLAALLEDAEPAPPTAAVEALLHTADGLPELLSLNPRSRRWVHHRAGEIASGSWVAADSSIAEVNLAVTTAMVCAALR